MNIETLQHFIDTFNREVVDSGFKRDLDDFSSSLPASQANILALRDIAEKVLAKLEQIYNGDLPAGLKILLPNAAPAPFTISPHNEQLLELISNKEIAQAEFFAQLAQLLAQLQAQIETNVGQVSKIETFIEPYLNEDIKRLVEGNNAVISIIFNEQQTISSLSNFSKTVVAWNRALPIYHQLVKSDPPSDVRLVEIQNGSIDLIVNLNVDVALDIAELFKIGFSVFAAYLSYKKLAKPIIDSYYGHKRLVAQEDEREKLLLENIGEAVRDALMQQHKRAKKSDKSVDATAVDKKVELVANLVTSHIVHGNDLKLLALPDRADDSIVTPDFAEKLREQSAIARLHLRQIPLESQMKLLEVYGKIGDATE